MKITIFSEELRKCLDAAGLSDCGENNTWNYWYQRLMNAYNESVERQIMTEQAENSELRERIVRCRDCKYGHITINGKSCKWCDLIATHDIDGNEPNNGYDPEPYFDADFFCAWGKRREVD